VNWLGRWLKAVPTIGESRERAKSRFINKLSRNFDPSGSKRTLSITCRATSIQVDRNALYQ
jgi:hypothetical protein